MKQPEPSTPVYHHHEIVVTPVGVLVVECSDVGLRAIHRFDNAVEAKRFTRNHHCKPANVLCTKVASAIRTLCSGERPLLDFSFDLISGTDLQMQVWKAIATIPYGKTISYSELAETVGKPAAVRAVASACGKNPVPLIIPCHRVLAKDGSLGGFAWGLDAKELLLKLERSTTPTTRKAA